MTPQARGSTKIRLSKAKPRPKPCKECEPGSKRAAPYPGPRCATHYRIFKNTQKAHGHERMVTQKYGIGVGEYATRYEAQGGRCAICARATGATKRLAVDHDHATGRVRGLLCSPCNRFIGYVRDDPEAFLRAYRYLSGSNG